MEVPKPEELTILVVLTDLRRERGSFVLAGPVSLKSQLHFVLAVVDLALSPFFFFFLFFSFLGFSSPQSCEFVFVFGSEIFFFFLVGPRIGPNPLTGPAGPVWGRSGAWEKNLLS